MINGTKLDSWIQNVIDFDEYQLCPDCQQAYYYEEIQSNFGRCKECLNSIVKVEN